MPSLPDIDLSSNYQNVKYEHLMLYSTNALNSTDGTIDIVFIVNNQGKIFSLDIGPLSRETPYFTQPQTSVQNQALQFLDRYANYSGESYIEDVNSLITTYGIATPLTEGIGDTTFQIINLTNDPTSPYIAFIRAPENINNTYDGMDIQYSPNGVLVQFDDFWNRVPIGSFDINVNQSEALQIAEQAAEAYSFTYDNMTLSHFVLSNATNAVMCDLQMQPRNGSLYPLYGFSLGLSRMYTGGITELQVGVWADTGQVSEVNYVASYGELSGVSGYGEPSGASLTAPPASSPPQTSNLQKNATWVTSDDFIVAVSAVVVAIAVSTVVLKKRRHKQKQ